MDGEYDRLVPTYDDYRKRMDQADQNDLRDD